MLNPNWQSKFKNEDWALWKSLGRFYLGNRRYDIDSIYPEHKAQINYLLDKYYVTNSGSRVSLNDKNLYTKLDMLQRVMKDLEYAESSDDSADKWHEQMDLEQDPYDVYTRQEEIRRNKESRQIMRYKISSRDTTAANIEYNRNFQFEDYPSDYTFDADELVAGIKVEMEHANPGLPNADNLAVAKEIAKDHLMEDSKYYSKLKTIHKD